MNSSASFTSFCVGAFTLKHTFRDDNCLLFVPFTFTEEGNDDHKHLIPLFGIGQYNFIIVTRSSPPSTTTALGGTTNLQN